MTVKCLKQDSVLCKNISLDLFFFLDSNRCLTIVLITQLCVGVAMGMLMTGLISRATLAQVLCQSSVHVFDNARQDAADGPRLEC